MAKDRAFDTMDTSWTTQPEKGSAEGPIDYGKAANSPEPPDPMGVMPDMPPAPRVGPVGKD
jgi:hypothetical protein